MGYCMNANGMACCGNLLQVTVSAVIDYEKCCLGIVFCQHRQQLIRIYTRTVIKGQINDSAVRSDCRRCKSLGSDNNRSCRCRSIFILIGDRIGNGVVSGTVAVHRAGYHHFIRNIALNIVDSAVTGFFIGNTVVKIDDCVPKQLQLRRHRIIIVNLALYGGLITGSIRHRVSHNAIIFYCRNLIRKISIVLIHGSEALFFIGFTGQGIVSLDAVQRNHRRNGIHNMYDSRLGRRPFAEGSCVNDFVGTDLIRIHIVFAEILGVMRNNTFFLKNSPSESNVNTGVVISLSISQRNLAVTTKGHLQRIFIDQLH